MLGRCRMIAVAVFASLAWHWPAACAADFTATVYDDGLACPGDCDAHVVFAPAHNGTRSAFLPPLSGRSAPRPCINGQSCVICFSDDDASCVEVTYRGSGPPKNRFDLTPAFLAATCPSADLPKQIANLCTTLAPLVARYAKRANCFAEPDRNECRDVIAAAKAAKDADTLERTACLADERAYNARQTDTGKQRSLGCNYELIGTGKNAKGITWRKLLPAACREGTYVDPSGEDCCSGEPYAAANFHPQCSRFFPVVKP
jgi:hypothetical protein